MSRTLSIDIETFSDVNLKTCGLYRYVESEAFKILLFAYAFDDEPVQLIDLEQGESLPQEVIEALQDEEVIKTAFNAKFEIICLEKFYNVHRQSWRCTQQKALYLGLGMSLESVGKALSFEADSLKDKQGTLLIKYFCEPCKPTKTNNGRTRNLPFHDPEKWQAFKSYCQQDIVAERAIRKTLDPFKLPEMELRYWFEDFTINERGVAVDADLINKALAFSENYKNDVIDTLKALTGLDNPNSAAQLKDWLSKETGESINSVSKDTVLELLANTQNLKVKQVLELRQELSKTSTSKFQKMADMQCSDGRIRVLLQFYGANTGRWAGRGVQVHNLPRPSYSNEVIDTARTLLKHGTDDLFTAMYTEPLNILSSMIRSAFIARNGCRFIVADFSAIEARVIAWLAGEGWRQEVFKNDGKIYEASAAQMFHVDVNTIVHGHENYALRAKGKVAELALGYQGGVGAMLQMGASNMGLTEEEIEEIVVRWRQASPNIVKLWHDVEKAFKTCVEQKSTQRLKRLTFRSVATEAISAVAIGLPSGRSLVYPRAKLSRSKQGFDKLSYVKDGKRTDTYGGKLVENIVQAIARDCLALTITRLEHRGYHIVMHVHDEVIIEAPNNQGTLEEVLNLMKMPIRWAEGLRLEGAGFEASYYRKE